VPAPFYYGMCKNVTAGMPKPQDWKTTGRTVETRKGEAVVTLHLFYLLSTSDNDNKVLAGKDAR